MTAAEYVEVYKKNQKSDDRRSNAEWLVDFAESYHQYRKNRYWIIRLLKL